MAPETTNRSLLTMKRAVWAIYNLGLKVSLRDKWKLINILTFVRFCALIFKIYFQEFVVKLFFDLSTSNFAFFVRRNYKIGNWVKFNKNFYPSLSSKLQVEYIQQINWD